MIIASASREEMSSEGFPPRSNTHGNSSFVMAWLNHLEVDGEGCPSESSSGNHPPMPVLSELAWASTLGACSIEVILH